MTTSIVFADSSPASDLHMDMFSMISLYESFPHPFDTYFHTFFPRQNYHRICASTSHINPHHTLIQLRSGAQVFAGNCAACHAGGNNVIQNEKTLRKDALTSYLAGGFSEASIVTQVTNGKNAMPAFGGRLDDDEIKDVAAYVFDQANGGKWD